MRPIIPFLALLTLGIAGTALAAEPVGPSTPAKLAPPAASVVLPGANPAPVLLVQFPGCAPGYFPSDRECYTCGTIPPVGYQGCTTCSNLWTGDEYTSCGGCDFNSECIVP